MKKKVFIISQGHMDLEWYQTLEGYRPWFDFAIEKLSELDSAEPDYRHYYLDGSFSPLEEALTERPEWTERVRELVRRRKLGIGPFYTQFDEFLTSGESMILNLLWGTRKSEAMGGCIRSGYFPDNFGHPAQLPQILRGFGIDNLFFMRGMVGTPGRTREFFHEAPDGSRVNAVNSSYCSVINLIANNSPLSPYAFGAPGSDAFCYGTQNLRDISVHRDTEGLAGQLIQSARDFDPFYPSGLIPFFLGCDHCPPQEGLSRTVALANRMQSDYDFRMTDAEEYAEALRESLKKSLPAPPTVRGDLFGTEIDFIFQGALSTGADLKLLGDRSERLLLQYAHPLAACNRLCGGFVPASTLREAEKNLLYNSTHDSIHATSLDAVHVTDEARAHSCEQTALRLAHEGLETVGRTAKIPAGRDGAAAVYFPHPGETSPARVRIRCGNDSLILFDSDGNRIPYAFLPRETPPLNKNGDPSYYPLAGEDQREILFPWRSGDPISMLSYERVPKVPGDELVPSPQSVIENEFLSLRVEENSLVLTDKATGKTYCGVAELHENADAGDVWDSTLPWLPAKEYRSRDFKDGKVSALTSDFASILTLDYEMILPEALTGDRRSRKTVRLPVTLCATVVKGIPRADVKITLRNTAKDHRVRMRFSWMDDPASTRVGKLFGSDSGEWKENYYREGMKRVPTTREIPFRDWILSRSSDRSGLAVALRGVYAFEAGENGAEVTLFRSVGKMTKCNLVGRKSGHFGGSYDLDLAQCLCKMEFYCSFLLIRPDESPASVTSRVFSFLESPMTHPMHRLPQGTREKDFFPVQWSASENLLFSTFRRSYDDNCDVLRFWESAGEEATLSFRTHVYRRVFLSDLQEKEKTELFPDSDGSYSLSVSPGKLMTLLLFE